MFPALAMMVRAGLEKQKRRETAKEVERCVLEPGVAWWSIVLRREEFLGGERHGFGGAGLFMMNCTILTPLV